MNGSNLTYFNFFVLVFFQIVPGLCKVLQSERMWTDMATLVRAVFPALLLLRLADQKKPGMDKLYYYCRQMDGTIIKSKDLLDKMEVNYRSDADSPYDSIIGSSFSKKKMIEYFTQSQETQNFFNEENAFERQEEDSDDESSTSSNEAEPEIDDDDADENEILVIEESLGTRVKYRWDHRKKKLVTDLSITGWMVSPSAEIMSDCLRHHDGTHRNAVERILRQWILKNNVC